MLKLKQLVTQSCVISSNELRRFNYHDLIGTVKFML